jgi:hypothetical protein
LDDLGGFGSRDIGEVRLPVAQDDLIGFRQRE